MNQIYNKSSEYMSELTDDSIQLIVTSPPYYVGKEYEKDLTEIQYWTMLYGVWVECQRVLEPGGRICINVANTGRKPYVPMNAKIIDQMLDIGYMMRGEIIWDKGASVGSSTAWGSWMSASNPVLRDVHEYILIFSKEQYGRKTKEKSTIEKEEFTEYTKSVWKFPTESAKRVGHPAPFPIELPRRLIQLYSYKDDTILDPFMGSGSTAIAAKMCHRQYVGYDRVDEYVTLAIQRIKESFKQ